MSDYLPGHIPAVITLSVIVGILLIGFVLLIVYIKIIKPKHNKDNNLNLSNNSEQQNNNEIKQ